MKLITGLGNPGPKYAKTWHNLGFLAIDCLAEEFGFGKFKLNKKFNAELAAGRINREKAILAKPQTFMNQSGLAVAALAQYHKIKPEDVIVIHDDVDLPLGKIRIAKDSSAGGHNGIKSIIEHLKTRVFIRVKIGIKTARAERVGALDYVLEKFSQAEEKIILGEIKKTTSAIEVILENGVEFTMNEFN